MMGGGGVGLFFFFLGLWRVEGGVCGIFGGGDLLCMVLLLFVCFLFVCLLLLCCFVCVGGGGGEDWRGGVCPQVHYTDKVTT